MKKDKWIKIIRITAKIWSAAIFLFMALMIVGHIFGEQSGEALPTLWEAVAMIFFPIGVLVGLVIAWKRELLGGLISINSMIVFYFILFFLRGEFPRGYAFLIIIIPAILFALSGFLLKNKKKIH